MALYTDLLGHKLEKFAGVTVFDATFYDKDNNPVITFDTLTVSNITTDASQKEIRGGQGANLLLSYDYGRTAEIEITDALASMYSLQYLWGGKLKKTGKMNVLARRVGVIGDDLLDDAGTITGLKVNKDTNYTLIVENDGVNNQTGGKVSADNKLISTGKIGEAGDRYQLYVEAEYDMGDSDSTVMNSHLHELTLTSVDFPAVMKLVGETFFVDASTGKKVLAQIEIPRFKPSANFSFTFEAEGEASVFDFTGTALADGTDILKLRTLGYEDAKFAGNEETDVRDKVGKNPEDGKKDTTWPSFE